MFRMSKKTVLSTMIGSLLGLSAAPALAMVLENNTIQGQVRFSNMDPTVVGLLQQLGITSALVKGQSTTVGTFNSSSYATVGTPISRDYQLSAESGAGGPAGITYTLDADATIYSAAPYSAQGMYYFQPVPGVILQPPAQQPSGVDADIAECVGLVHIRFGLDAQCSTPVVVDSGSMTTPYSASHFQNSSEHYVLQLGGTTITRDLVLTTGNDPTQNTINIAFPLTMNPACDAIQEICIDMSPYIGNGSAGLGALTGPFDVVGETEVGSTYVQAMNGPAGNWRHNWFTPPEMPANDPSTWWLLPNMVPGSYAPMSAQTYLRSGRQTTKLQTPWIGTPGTGGPPVVQAGVTSDLMRTINGASRYPFVMAPAYFQGSIMLADPFVTNNAGATSMLSNLAFSSYAPGSAPIVDLTTLRAEYSYGGTGLNETSFDGAFDPTVGYLASSYDQVVVNPYDVKLPWVQRGLQLRYIELPAHVDGSITLQRDATDHAMEPGTVVRIDHRYCFNEVELQYTISSGQLFSPWTDVNGSFQGVDWSESQTQYGVSGNFRGWPTGQANAAPTGSVRLSLPQGSYSLQPGAYVQVLSGGVSTATFASTHLDVGCGQRIVAAPGFSISADVASCAQSATPEIIGSVSSDGAPVDRIWYTVNGSAQEYDICAMNCGADPSFSVSAIAVALAACNNTVEIFARSGGQTVSVQTQTTWEDPNDEINCEGPCEPPPPPTSTCAVMTAQELACSGGEGGYQVAIAVTNTTNEPIAHFMIADTHVSPHVVTLPMPLQPGDSTTVDVSIHGVNPGSSFCMNVGIMNDAHDECCSQVVCMDIPACCFAVTDSKSACIPDEPAGNFTHEFTFQNRTLDTIEHVFIIPPVDVTAFPDYVDIPSTPPGGTAQVGPITFLGAHPNEELCVTVGIHDQEMNQCCSEDICFNVPEPCPKNPPEKEALRANGAACSISTEHNSTSMSPILLGLAALVGMFRRRRQS